MAVRSGFHQQFGCRLGICISEYARLPLGKQNRLVPDWQGADVH